MGESGRRCQSEGEAAGVGEVITTQRNVSLHVDYSLYSVSVRGICTHFHLTVLTCGPPIPSRYLIF